MEDKPDAPQAVEPDADLLAWADRVAAHVAAKLPPSFELDDLKQVARIAVCRYLPRYEGDHTSGAPVQGYLYPYVAGAVKMSVRRRAWADNTMSPISPRAASSEDGEASADGRRKSKILAWLIRERLTEQQQFCVLQAQAGVTSERIAARLRVPRRAVIESLESAYEQLRTDLREMGL